LRSEDATPLPLCVLAPLQFADDLRRKASRSRGWIGRAAGIAICNSLSESESGIEPGPNAVRRGWQTAIGVLMLCSRNGPTMLARIAIMKALNRHVARVFTTDAKIPIGGAEAQAGSVISLVLR
jgi:hypothetical protein